MDNYYIQSNLLIAASAFPVIIGIVRFKSLDPASRLFFFMVVVSALGEALGYYTAIFYRNSHVIYNVSNIVELFLVCLYFNQTTTWLKRWNIGVVIGVLSVVFGVINNFFIQSFYGITNIFLFYQTLISVIMSLGSISTFLKFHDTRKPYKEIRFWLPVCLIFLWMFTYLFYSFTIRYYLEKQPIPYSLTLSLCLINVIYYIAIGIVFYLSPKLKKHA